MTHRIDISPLSQILQRVDAIADGAPSADTIPSGFPSLDEPLGGGFRRGDLIVLGGDVGAGKSSLALAMALRMAQSGRTVALYTGEMSEERVLERALALEARLEIDQLRHGASDDSSRAALGAAALRLRADLPRVDRIPGGGLATISDHVREAPTLELIVIDALQSLPLGSGGQDEEMAASVRQLKSLAVNRGIAVLLTAHLPALDRSRQDRRPALDDFGALGAVKQQADIVLGIYREEMYEASVSAEGATELAILKNRSGATTYIDLYFYKRWLRFEDMVEPDR